MQGCSCFSRFGRVWFETDPPFSSIWLDSVDVARSYCDSWETAVNQVHSTGLQIAITLPSFSMLHLILFYRTRGQERFVSQQAGHFVVRFVAPALPYTAVRQLP